MLLFIFTTKILLLLLFYLFIFSCKLFYFFMFRDVPECSGMFHVPGFIDGLQFVLQKSEILHSVRGLYDKNSASWYFFTSDVMYKKYKRLAYTSPDLLARLCKLVERKKFGLICFLRICFPGLIYCDREPLWLLNVIEDDCYFLGLNVRLLTRCKIKFTLSLDCLQIIFL